MREAIRIGTLSTAAAVLGCVLAAGAQVPAPFMAGLSWRSLGPFSGPVAAVQGLAGQPGVYWIQTPSGEIWQTADGGETWRQGEAGAPGSAWVKEWSDPQHPARGIRVNPKGNGVEITLDQGGHWLAPHNLAIAQITAVTSDDRFPITIHATLSDGTIDALPLRDDVGPAAAAPPPTPPVPEGLKFRPAAAGVEVSFDGGLHWQSLRLNLPPVEVKQVLVAGDSLVAATWGRSVWVLDNIEPLEQLAERVPAAEEPVLFRPPTVVRLRPAAAGDRPADLGAPPLGAYFDFYLPQAPRESVRLEITDAAGAVLHRESSEPQPGNDRWLPPQPPLPAHAGEIRVAWDGHADPPPSPDNKYLSLAPVLGGAAPKPAGPLLPPGTYGLRLLVDGRVLTQSLRVVDDPRTVASTVASTGASMAAAARSRWTFERQLASALGAGHAGFLQVEALRAQLRPLLDNADPDTAQAAQDLNAQLAAISGAGWNGLVLPDEIEKEPEPVEDKDDLIDVYTPHAQSMTQDYDDPTTILGRSYDNADTTPTFANAGSALAQVLTGAEARDDAPGAIEFGAWQQACATLSQAIQRWTDALGDPVANLNALLVTDHAKPLSVPAPVAGPSCGE